MTRSVHGRVSLTKEVVKLILKTIFNSLILSAKTLKSQRKKEIMGEGIECF